MKRFLALTMFFLMMTQVARADSDAVVGFWASDNSIFEITITGDTLTGEVRALLNPTYLPDENAERSGEARTDDNNPDEGLRNRPIMGLSMFSEYAFEDGLWQGKIYDPESGNTHQSRMKINRKGNLEIRGYVGMPMFGRTAEFVPVSSCTDAIVQMLPQLKIASPCAAQ